VYTSSKTDAQEWMDYLADEIGQNDGTGRGLRVDVVSVDLDSEQVEQKTSAFIREDSFTKVLFSSEVLGIVDIKATQSSRFILLSLLSHTEQQDQPPDV
jgi:hypothetical protein